MPGSNDQIRYITELGREAFQRPVDEIKEEVERHEKIEAAGYAFSLRQDAYIALAGLAQDHRIDGTDHTEPLSIGDHKLGTDEDGQPINRELGIIISAYTRSRTTVDKNQEPKTPTSLSVEAFAVITPNDVAKYFDDRESKDNIAIYDAFREGDPDIIGYGLGVDEYPNNVVFNLGDTNNANLPHRRLQLPEPQITPQSSNAGFAPIQNRLTLDDLTAAQALFVQEESTAQEISMRSYIDAVLAQRDVSGASLPTPDNLTWADDQPEVPSITR